MSVKVDKKGKITIPKNIRDLYGFTSGTELVLEYNMEYDGPRIVLRPRYCCSACKKALPAELAERGACLDCTPVPKEIAKIY